MSTSGHNENSPDFVPTRVREIELSRPIPALNEGATEMGEPYGATLVLARLHDEPLGLVEVQLRDSRLPARDLAKAIWREISDPIRRHLKRDGLKDIERLPVEGLAMEGLPACTRQRSAFVEEGSEITVLIPSRERTERLRRCLYSIFESSFGGRFEVIVVDNAPETDSTRQLIEELRTDGQPVRYLREDAPGSASARNRGIPEVQTELVAMTDDDVIVDRRWLSEVARTFDSFPRAACVTGLVVPNQLDTPAERWFEEYGGFTRGGFSRKLFNLDDHRPDDPLFPWTAGNFGTGNNFAFRVEALRRVGGFDPALGNGTPALGGVDSELLLRMVLSGELIVYEPRAIVNHAHRPDYHALRRQVYAYGVGLTSYYLKTIFSSPRLAADFLRRIPAGLRFLLDPNSAINQAKSSGYPRELDWIERRGMLRGLSAYPRSRRRYGPHRLDTTAQPLTVAANTEIAT